jgi:hypothetical protein
MNAQKRAPLTAPGGPLNKPSFPVIRKMGSRKAERMQPPLTETVSKVAHTC